jgi:hypothetical protein
MTVSLDRLRHLPLPWAQATEVGERLAPSPLAFGLGQQVTELRIGLMMLITSDKPGSPFSGG